MNRREFVKAYRQDPIGVWKMLADEASSPQKRLIYLRHLEILQSGELPATQFNEQEADALATFNGFVTLASEGPTKLEKFGWWLSDSKYVAIRLFRATVNALLWLKVPAILSWLAVVGVFFGTYGWMAVTVFTAVSAILAFIICTMSMADPTDEDTSYQRYLSIPASVLLLFAGCFAFFVASPVHVEKTTWDFVFVTKGDQIVDAYDAGGLFRLKFLPSPLTNGLKVARVGKNTFSEYSPSATVPTSVFTDVPQRDGKIASRLRDDYLISYEVMTNEITVEDNVSVPRDFDEAVFYFKGSVNAAVRASPGSTLAAKYEDIYRAVVEGVTHPLFHARFKRVEYSGQFTEILVEGKWRTLQPEVSK